MTYVCYPDDPINGEKRDIWSHFDAAFAKAVDVLRKIPSPYRSEVVEVVHQYGLVHRSEIGSPLEEEMVQHLCYVAAGFDNAAAGARRLYEQSFTAWERGARQRLYDFLHAGWRQPKFVG